MSRFSGRVNKIPSCQGISRFGCFCHIQAYQVLVIVVAFKIPFPGRLPAVNARSPAPESRMHRTPGSTDNCSKMAFNSNHMGG